MAEKPLRLPCLHETEHAYVQFYYENYKTISCKTVLVR